MYPLTTLTGAQGFSMPVPVPGEYSAEKLLERQTDFEGDMQVAQFPAERIQRSGQRATGVIRRMKILIADDQELFRASVRKLLEKLPYVEKIYEADTCLETLAVQKEFECDLVLLNYDMPDGTGLSIVETLSTESYGWPSILLLTGLNTGFVLLQAVETGVPAVLSKNDSSRELLEAVNAIHTDGIYLSKGFHKAIDGEKVLNSLTSRENQVILKLTQGLSIQEVAEELCLSLKAAQTHKTRIMQKLGVQSHNQLIARVQKMGAP